MGDSRTSSEPGIVLHHLEDSRSHRILWLLEELEVPYTIKEYKRLPNKQAPPELRKVHPLGKAPVITDGGRTFAESGLIIEYLIGRYGEDKFGVKRDVNSEAWIDNTFFIHYSEGSVQPNLLQRALGTVVVKEVPFFVRPFARLIFRKIDEAATSPDLKRHGQLIEAQLTKVESKGGWLAGAGHPTSADFMMSITLQIFLKDAPEYAGPKTKEYVKRVQERPAYKKVLALPGGSLDFLYTES